MERKSYLYILTAASLWGCIGVFTKLLAAAGLSSMETVAVRSLLAVLLFGLYLFVTDRDALKINPRHWYYFFATGVCSQLFFNWCYFSTIANSSMSVAAVLLYTSPVFVTLMSAVFFKERLTTLKLGALALTFGGCVLVTGLFPFGQQSLTTTTLMTGLGAGFGYAMYSILGKFALAKYQPTTVTFYTFLFTAAFSLPISGIHRHLELLVDRRAIVGAFGVGLLCYILPNLLYTKGLQYAEAGKAAILATLEPFVAALLGIGLYHEEVTVYKLLGMAAIFAAILLLNRPAKKSSTTR